MVAVAVSLGATTTSDGTAVGEPGSSAGSVNVHVGVVSPPVPVGPAIAIVLGSAGAADAGDDSGAAMSRVPNHEATTTIETAARERARTALDLRAVSPIRRASRSGHPDLNLGCCA